MSVPEYSDNVFINCPFDKNYDAILKAIVFVVFDCGFIPRCSREYDDGSQVRIDKIYRLIAECKYGIHDISRTELDDDNGLPRFNMPLELGIFLGAKRFGNDLDNNKSCMIIDCEQYRFQKFISDISGQDVKTHDNDPEKAIAKICDWLRTASRRKTIPGGTEIIRRYKQFNVVLPEICAECRKTVDELNFNDYCLLVSDWLKEKQE
jgi:hypothetical protein